MKFEKRHAIAILAGLLVLVLDLIFFTGTVWLVPMIVVAITIGWSQYWIDFFVNIQKQRNIEARFPDFVRYLVGGIRSGMPVSQAIIHVANTDFGSLSPHIKKLANQIEWSIPVHKALKIFAKDTNNPVIKRSIATVIEAEQAGGNIEDVLDTVTRSVIDIKKIKQKRKASIHSQIVQSYVIFIVFLVIMVVVQNMVIPYVSGLTQRTGIEGTGIDAPVSLIRETPASISETAEIDFSSVSSFFSSVNKWFISLRGVIMMIALIQGLFTGIVIGKLAEGQVSPGLKHSLILMTLAFLVISISHGI